MIFAFGYGTACDGFTDSPHKHLECYEYLLCHIQKDFAVQSYKIIWSLQQESNL